MDDVPGGGDDFFSQWLIVYLLMLIMNQHRETIRETPDEPKGDNYFHYTTRENRDRIRNDNSLDPSPKDGVLYLTRDVYTSGAQAQNRLHMRRTPEGAFIIPGSLVPGAKGPTPVLGPNGVPTGGREYKYPGSIPAAGLVWIDIGP
jgi:hypothetical protein